MSLVNKHPCPILVSACLMGIACRYDGASKPKEDVLSLGQRVMFVPYCPETRGGLSTPRPPAERQPNGRLINDKGEDVTAAYEKGAQDAVTLCKDFNIKIALLKSRSPACGPYSTYDGTFTHTLTDRAGVMAEALKEAGIKIFSEEELPALEAYLETLK